MNILIVGKFYIEGFATHIAETLEMMGHSTFRYDPGMKVEQAKSKFDFRLKQVKVLAYQLYSKSPYYVKKAERKLLDAVEGVSCDVAIVCHDFLTPQEVKILKRKINAPIALWFPDPVSYFGKAMFFDASYDFLFFKEPFIVRVLQKEFGRKAFYLPECCNPLYHRPQELSEAEAEYFGCDITTAGNMHSARAAIFKHLTAYHVKIWGNPAPHWMDTTGIEKMIMNKFVSNNEKSKAFVAARIVLNTMHPTEVCGVNVRMFEIAATGAFQLVNYRPGIKQLFKIGEEIIVFYDLHDMKEKIDHYLIHQEERKLVADRALVRTQQEHTYQKRLELMLATIGGTTNGFTLLDHYN